MGRCMVVAAFSFYTWVLQFLGTVNGRWSKKLCAEDLANGDLDPWRIERSFVNLNFLPQTS